MPSRRYSGRSRRGAAGRIAHAGPDRRRRAFGPGFGIPPALGLDPAVRAGWVALALLLLGLALSPLVTWRYFDAYLLGMILVVAYAAPPLRLAELRPGSVAAQTFGYGALTFYAGSVASQAPPISSWYLFGFILLFLALEAGVGRISARRGLWAYWALVGGGLRLPGRRGDPNGRKAGRYAPDRAAGRMVRRPGCADAAFRPAIRP